MSTMTKLLPAGRIGQRRSAPRAPGGFLREAMPSGVASFHRFPENQSDKLRRPQTPHPSLAMLRRFSEQPVLEENHKLPHYYTPISNRHSPLFADFLYRKIYRFSDGIVGWIDCFIFRIFTQHTMKAFNSVGRINQRSDFLRVLKIS